MQKYIKEYQDNGFTIAETLLIKVMTILKDLEEYKITN